MQKRMLITTVVYLLTITLVLGQTKTINLSFSGSGIQEGYLPCLENFNVNVPSVHLGAPVTNVVISIYDTYGKSYGNLSILDPAAANLPQTITALPTDLITKRHPTLVAFQTALQAPVPAPLTGAQVAAINTTIQAGLITTQSLYTGNGATLAVQSYTPTNVPNPGQDFVVYVAQHLFFKRYYYLRCSFTYTPAGGAAVNTTSEFFVYSTATKNELTVVEAFTSVGGCFFTTAYDKNDRGASGKNIRPNAMLITGLKFRFRPTSTNAHIGDYGLFPRASRWSFIVGLTLTDLKYKNSDVTGWGTDFVKPTIGFEVDLWKVLGFQVGTIFAQQVSTLPTNSFKRFVAAPYISLSLSADLFTRLKPNTPATSSNQSQPN